MHIPSSILIGLALLSRGALAESSFSQPPPGGPANNFQDNPTYKDGEKIDLQWNSNLTTMDLLIWQQYPSKSDGDFYSSYLLQDTRSTSLIWTVDLSGFRTDVGKGQAAVFYLALYAPGVADMDASSHYFNVTIDSASTSSASATATTTKQAASSSAAKASETTTEASDSSKGLSTGAVAGIAVGATAVGLVLLGSLGFFLWKRLRKEDSGGKYTPGQQYPPPEMNNNNWIQTPQTMAAVPVHQQVPQVFEAPTDRPKQAPVYEAP